MSMLDTTAASRLRDAEYWRRRAEGAEEQVKRLSAEVERLRDAEHAVYLIGKVLGVERIRG